MRVGLISYPMLFQRNGGLQVQVGETLRALAAAGHQVGLVDPAHADRADFDLLHVFGSMNGNHRLVAAARAAGLPVVLSALVAPSWNAAAGRRARLAGWLAGALSAMPLETTYAHIRSALRQADLVIALGAAEKTAIVRGFRIAPDKVRLVPNGVGARFFDADPAPFRAAYGIAGRFALCVGAISPYKNQLGLAQALAALALPLVLIGPVEPAQAAYLQALLDRPAVRWLGALEHGDPLLAGAYAAAAVVALPSRGEVFPLAILEALAAGTPAVMTDESALTLPASGFALKRVQPDDRTAIAGAVAALLAQPPCRAAVSALVRDFSWPQVAAQLSACYEACHGHH
ncbi:glycosyltransferase [Duganella sp. FT109W]|uniref:Glycosyltransferase n=3 Tax=Duganella margarita TaxID=2692170 RepID=A0ABW9WPN8_9BURK|nr:glycosyltransferase family 4 protein [Duganella margarita]MYN42154.1 glycosyltransferase [Duganella margarita]